MGELRGKVFIYFKAARFYIFHVNRGKFLRLRNQQVANCSGPLLRIRPIAGAFAIPRKEDIKGKRKAYLPKAHVGGASEFRPVGICVGHKIAKIGNCLPECC